MKDADIIISVEEPSGYRSVDTIELDPRDKMGPLVLKMAGALQI